MQQETFWQKNQVLIAGIASALLITLQQFTISPEGEVDWKAIGLAALIAVASYIGNQFRGKGVTVAGFIGVAATSAATIQSTGMFTWSQFGFACLVGFLALVTPPTKDAGYDQSHTSQQAKAEGPDIQSKVENTPAPQVSGI